MALSPLQRIEGLPDAAERQLLAAYNALVAEINRLSQAGRVTPLSGSGLASEGETRRVRGGSTITLPRARIQNQGARITVILETPGELRIVARDSLVNGGPSFTTSALGAYEWESNGAGGWFGTTPGATDPATAAARASAIAPTPTWAEVLVAGNNSDISNAEMGPGTRLIVPGGQSVGDGDIHSAADMTLDAATDMHLHADGTIHVGHAGGTTDAVHVAADLQVSIDSGADTEITAGTTITENAGTDWAANAVAGSTTLNAFTFVRLITGGVVRFTVEADGSWNIGGSNGTAGQALVSNGAAAPPSWQTLAFGWDDVLAVDNNSGANNPHIDTGQFLGFGSEGSLPASGQIRSSTNFSVNVTGFVSVGGSTLATLTSGSGGTTTTFTAGGGAGAGAIISTGGSERLEIETTGAWQLGGLVGSAGQYLRSSGAGASPTWASLELSELPSQAADTFLGRLAGAGTPTVQLLSDIDSTSIIYDAVSHTFQRAALTGFVDSAQNSNATTSAEPIVTYSASANMSAERVTTSTTSIGVSIATAGQVRFERSALTGAITAGNNDNATLFGATASGAGLTGGGTAILAVGAGTGITVNADDVAVNTGANFSWTGTHTFGAAVMGAGVFSTTLAATTSNLAIGSVNCVRITLTGSQSLTGMVPTADGQWVFIENVDDTDSLALVHDATSTAANRFYIPRVNTGFTETSIGPRSGKWVRYDGTLQRWIVADGPMSNLSISKSPTTSVGATSLEFIDGTGITVTHGATPSTTGNAVTETIALASAAANTIKANATGGAAAPADLAIGADSLPARVGGNLVSHGFSTLAGAALDYAAGVIDVAVNTSYDIQIDSASDLIYRKSRHRDYWYEDFTFAQTVSGGTTVTTSGMIGNAQNTNWWLVAGGASGVWDVQTGISGHPGIWRLTTGATSGNSLSMYNGVANTFVFGTIRADQIYMVEACIRIPTVTTKFWGFGLSDSGNNQAIFYADTSAGTGSTTLIHTKTAEGGVVTDTNTAITDTANAWNVYTILQDTVGTIDFYIDDVLTNSHSTNVPDAETVGVFFQILTRTASTRSMDIDFVYWETRDLGGRTS